MSSLSREKKLERALLKMAFEADMDARMLDEFMEEWAEPHGTTEENRFYRAAEEVVAHLKVHARQAQRAAFDQVYG